MAALGPVTPPSSETLRMQQPQTVAYLERRELGTGTLYVGEHNVVWVGADNVTGFSLPYKAISLHALSRDLSSFPHECIYMMLDPVKAGASPDEAQAHMRAHAGRPNGVNGAGGDDGRACDEDDSEPDSDDGEPVAEMRFVPLDKSALQAIYETLNECQALNPDSEVELSDDDEQHYDDDDHDHHHEDDQDYDAEPAEDHGQMEMDS